MLDPDVVLRVDGGAGLPEITTVVRGAESVASRALMFSIRGGLVQPAVVNGAAGVVVTVNGRLFSVMAFTVADGRIVEIDALGDPDRLRDLDLAVLGEGQGGVGGGR